LIGILEEDFIEISGWVGGGMAYTLIVYAFAPYRATSQGLPYEFIVYLYIHRHTQNEPSQYTCYKFNDYKFKA